MFSSTSHAATATPARKVVVAAPPQSSTCAEPHHDHYRAHVACILEFCEAVTRHLRPPMTEEHQHALGHDGARNSGDGASDSVGSVGAAAVHGHKRRRTVPAPQSAAAVTTENDAAVVSHVTKKKKRAIAIRPPPPPGDTTTTTTDDDTDADTSDEIESVSDCGSDDEDGDDGDDCDVLDDDEHALLLSLQNDRNAPCVAETTIPVDSGPATESLYELVYAKRNADGKTAVVCFMKNGRDIVYDWDASLLREHRPAGGVDDVATEGVMELRTGRPWCAWHAVEYVSRTPNGGTRFRWKNYEGYGDVVVAASTLQKRVRPLSSSSS